MGIFGTKWFEIPFAAVLSSLENEDEEDEELLEDEDETELLSLDATLDSDEAAGVGGVGVGGLGGVGAGGAGVGAGDAS